MAKPPKRLVLILVVCLLALGGLAYWLLHRNQETTDDAMLEGRAIGMSPKVGGYVVALAVDDNQPVKAGEVLLKIDPTDYQLRRDRAQANLDAAQARLAASGQNLQTTRVSAPSNLAAARAQVDAAVANWQRAKADLSRMQVLSDEARSRQQLDEAVAAEKTARSNLENARAQLRSAQTAPKTIAAAEANRAELAALVKQAKAELAQAEKDLADTELKAPADGRVTKRGVELGDYVQPGQQLMSVVGNELWVVANFKETQLKHMKPGQAVDIHVDAFPNTKLHGKVQSFQAGTGARFSTFPSENATGNFVKIVQRVPVKIVLDAAPDGKLPLGPGMSVVPTVHVD